VPWFTNRIVGIDRIPYRAASPGFSSTLTFISVTRPAVASAISSRTGAIARHGPHHSAQVDHHETLGRDQRLIEVLLGQVDRLGHFVIPARTHLVGPPVP
jgi:hypothetical protein